LEAHVDLLVGELDETESEVRAGLDAARKRARLSAVSARVRTLETPALHDSSETLRAKQQALHQRLERLHASRDQLRQQLGTRTKRPSDTAPHTPQAGSPAQP
jgi:hypothetical protein